MPLILGTNSIKDTGYDVANSVRLDDGSSDGFSLSGQNGNRKTFTFSSWVKRGVFGENFLFNSRIDASNHFLIRFTGDHKLELVNRTSASNNFFITTNRLFRDVSAWYHILVAVDTTQSTANDRVKFYVNGVQETSFATQTIGSQSADLSLNTSSATHYIGQEYTSGFNFFDGYLCETVFIDGQQLAPDQFGEFDSDSGIWKPIDVSGLTFGTNGFYLDFENASNLGADVSGNGNNFTVNNLTSVDQSTDTCTNNFVTLNPLDNYYANSTLSEGNTKIVTGGSGREASNSSTIYLTQGKWYWETKFLSSSAPFVGIQPVVSSSNTGTAAVLQLNGLGILKTGKVETTDGSGGSTVLATYSTFTTNDIIGVALDLDGNKIYFYKNGSIYDASGVSITDPASTTNGHYMVAIGCIAGTDTISINFGNPSFTISSGNSDGNSYGNFEFPVPSGYYSICTKNLAEYG